MIYYTYAYLREDKTPYYIGKGKGNRAYRRSKTDIKPPKDKSRILILKKNLTEEEAFQHEIYMIAVFGRKDLGTGILHNRTDGGDGVSGWVPSDETRRKMSEVNKGKTLSEETKRKISKASKGGTKKPPSEETRKKLSEANKGKIPWNKGKPPSEETRRKISEANKGEKHNFYGKSFSEEHRRKLSEANTGKILSKEIREKMSISKTGNNNPNSYWWKLTFENKNEIIICGLKSWAKENGYSKGCIHGVYLGKRKRHKDIVTVEKLSIHT